MLFTLESNGYVFVVGVCGPMHQAIQYTKYYTLIKCMYYPSVVLLTTDNTGVRESLHIWASLYHTSIGQQRLGTKWSLRNNLILFLKGTTSATLTPPLTPLNNRPIPPPLIPTQGAHRERERRVEECCASTWWERYERQNKTRTVVEKTSTNPVRAAEPLSIGVDQGADATVLGLRGREERFRPK